MLLKENQNTDFPFLGKSVAHWMQLAQTQGLNSDEVAAARLYIYACYWHGYGLKKDQMAAADMILLA